MGFKVCPTSLSNPVEKKSKMVFPNGETQINF